MSRILSERLAQMAGTPATGEPPAYGAGQSYGDSDYSSPDYGDYAQSQSDGSYAQGEEPLSFEPINSDHDVESAVAPPPTGRVHAGPRTGGRNVPASANGSPT